RARSAPSAARRASSLRASQRDAIAVRSGRSARAGPFHRARASPRAARAPAASPSSRARLPLARQPLEAVQVHGVRRGGEPVAARHGFDGAVPQGPPQPADQGLERTGRVGGRVAVPHLVDEVCGRDGPAGAQRENGEQGAQPRPAEGDGRAVVAECPGGAEDAVVHGAHCP
ncbi:hypothetical protein GA0115253_106491, partial [Streptomyces sp. Termitarium-T10T-6]